MLLGLNMDTLGRWRRESGDRVKCCKRVFTYWFEANGHPYYPLTWEGLWKLLHELQEGTTVENVKKVLEKMEPSPIIAQLRI